MDVPRLQMDVPSPITFKSDITGICFQPWGNLIATSTIDGIVHLNRYAFSGTGNENVIEYNHHKERCRVVRFSDCGGYLFTGANDATICMVDLEANSVFLELEREDGSAVQSILPIDSFTMASGEKDGQVVLWDFRMQAPIKCFKDCKGYISSLIINRERKILLATSGDGILSTYDVHAQKLVAQSEEFDSELMCAVIFKNGSKVAVGAEDGSISIFNWGEFNNITDRFPGHPKAVDSMVVLSNDIICTRCEDGKIRAVQFFPNRILGVLRGHNGSVMKKLSLCHKRYLLATASHDQKVLFWDMSPIGNLENRSIYAHL